MDDAPALAAARRALFLGTLLLALVGGGLFWALRDILAAQILDDLSLSTTVGWLALGVMFAVASGSQGALLVGLRQLGDVARVSIGASLLSTALGVAALWLWGERGVTAFVLAVPLAAFVVSCWYVAKLPAIGGEPTPIGALVAQWKVLARVGAAFMISGVVVALGNLAVRMLRCHSGRWPRSWDRECLCAESASWQGP